LCSSKISLKYALYTMPAFPS